MKFALPKNMTKSFSLLPISLATLQLLYTNLQNLQNHNISTMLLMYEIYVDVQEFLHCLLHTYANDCITCFYFSLLGKGSNEVMKMILLYFLVKSKFPNIIITQL